MNLKEIYIFFNKCVQLISFGLNEPNQCEVIWLHFYTTTGKPVVLNISCRARDR